MISARDKDQVRKWSQRQLGTQARLATISEKELSDAHGFVERDGTGITAGQTEGCHPMMYIMANFARDLPDSREFHLENDSYVSSPHLEGTKPPTVH